MRVPGRAWKWLGVAGLAGVAATGAVVARDQRQRRQMAPDEIRERLRDRVAELDETSGADAGRGGAGRSRERRG